MNKMKPCAICGSFSYTSVDHIIPYAVHKWVSPLISKQEANALFRSIDSPKNIQYLCTTHNRLKGCSIPSNYHGDVNKKYIDMYIDIVNQIAAKCYNRCYVCHRVLPISYMDIRRLNKSLPKTVDNACLVCHDCARRGRFRPGGNDYRKYVRANRRCT